MRLQAAFCVIALTYLALFGAPAVAVGGATGITGSVPLVTYEVSGSGLRVSATISWKTNAAATSQVLYDTRSHDNTADYRYRTEVYAGSVTEHSVTLIRLRPGTTYHFRVRSAITGTDFVAVSDECMFATSRMPVVPVPPGPGPPPPLPPGPPPWRPPTAVAPPSVPSVVAGTLSDTAPVFGNWPGQSDESSAAATPPAGPEYAARARHIARVLAGLIVGGVVLAVLVVVRRRRRTA
jgi:hypothetical protein